jgi:4-amino-4-deoxy-L-arabinose transferase-like glycosyltransferase
MVYFDQIQKAIQNGQIHDASLDTLREYQKTLLGAPSNCSPTFLHVFKEAGTLVGSLIAKKESQDAETLRASAAREMHGQSVALELEKIEHFSKISKQVATIDGRLETVERKASRPEICTWGFWFAVIAIIVAICSWLFPRSPAGARPANPPNQKSQTSAFPTQLPALQSPLSSATSNSSTQSISPLTNTLPKP